MEYTNLLADRTKNMGASMLRELLKVTAQPGMMSLAGGLPAPESFPLHIVDELSSLVLKKYSSTALQYGPTEGFPPLREALAGYVGQRGIRVSTDDVLITSGSQGALDAMGKILINWGDLVAVESPTYLGAISAFNPYRPRYVGLKTDDDGVIPDALEEILQTQKIKFIYLAPTFQNPTGRTVPLERRIQIAQIISRHRALLVEDDPYNALRCRGEDLPPIQTLAPEHVVYTSTFSKILSPGLRIGYCIAPPLINRWLVLAKQGIDLHTSSFNQALAAEYLAGGHLDRHLPTIVAIYTRKQAAMLNALQSYFPLHFKWSKPDGGMFIWAEGPSDLDTDELYVKAIERKVVFVPGRHFCITEGEGRPAMRLNYTMCDEATIDQAIKILAEVIEEQLTAIRTTNRARLPGSSR